jgi:hypothetical protein
MRRHSNVEIKASVALERELPDFLVMISSFLAIFSTHPMRPRRFFHGHSKMVFSPFPDGKTTTSLPNHYLSFKPIFTYNFWSFICRSSLPANWLLWLIFCSIDSFQWRFNRNTDSLSQIISLGRQCLLARRVFHISRCSQLSAFPIITGVPA